MNGLMVEHWLQQVSLFYWINNFISNEFNYKIGSPFPPAKNPQTGKDYYIAEANNALIYPGLGLGTIASRSTKMSKGMILAGVRALANVSPALEDPDAPLLPDLADVRKVSLHIATAVVKQALEEGVAQINIKKDDDAIIEHIKVDMWDPVYRWVIIEFTN